MAVGIRITSNEQPVDTATPSQFAVDSEHPLWLCDLTKKPAHYGVLKAQINSLPAFAIRTLLSIPHGYQDTPSFITEWNCPTGSNPGSTNNQTYGIGSLQILSGSQIVTFRAVISESLFQIIADNGLNNVPFTNTYVEFRYYIFANSLNQPLTNS